MLGCMVGRLVGLFTGDQLRGLLSRPLPKRFVDMTITSGTLSRDSAHRCAKREHNFTKNQYEIMGSDFIVIRTLQYW